MTVPAIPAVSDAATQERMQHQRLRRDIVDGQWDKHVKTRLGKQIGHVRKAAWGEPDLSANVLQSVAAQLGVLYDSEPLPMHDDPLGLELAAAIADSGWWQQAQRVCRDTLAIREYHVRVIVSDDGRLQYRPVPPDLVDAEAPPWAPDQPHLYRELRLRERAGTWDWYWDVFDIRNPDSPSFHIEDRDGTNFTQAFMGGPAKIAGAAYMKRWSWADRPFIPQATYHAERTGNLYDPYAWREVVEGTLNAAMHWTFVNHCAMQASWPQRWTMGLQLAAEEVSPGEPSGRARAEADPSTVADFVKDPDFDGQPQIGQWTAAAEPSSLAEVAANYERRVAMYAGLSESDFVRVSGDPRSGYALSIAKEAARRAARHFEPQFRRSDQHLFAVSAALLGRVTGKAYPTEGYSIEYPGPPVTTAERLADLEEIKRLIELGLMDRVTAYRRIHPELTRDEAQKALEDIARANRAIGL